MGFVLSLGIGLFVGWLAAAIAEVDEGIFVRMGSGAVGAIGGFILAVAVFNTATALNHFGWLALFTSLIGALLFVSLTHVMQNRSRNIALRDRVTTHSRYSRSES